MQQSTLQYLGETLLSQGVDVYPCREEQFRSSQLKKTAAVPLLEEVYAALGGKDSCWKISVKLPAGLETEGVRISIDGALHFNRYRALSLQSAFYAGELYNWAEAYRRHCRSAERECLKDGSRQGSWTNPEAEKHFGMAQESGDFFGVGAAGWRMLAFRDFLTDVYLAGGSRKYKRISIYDRLMVQGQLLPLQQLLQGRNGIHQPYLFKFLARQLGQPPGQP